MTLVLGETESAFTYQMNPSHKRSPLQPKDTNRDKKEKKHSTIACRCVSVCECVLEIPSSKRIEINTKKQTLHNHYIISHYQNETNRIN